MKTRLMDNVELFFNKIKITFLIDRLFEDLEIKRGREGWYKPKSSKQVWIFGSENLIYKLQHRIRIDLRLLFNFIGNILEISWEK